ncbi:MAG: hypothetical protein AAFX94_24360 [Myxococcota bacterium]
MLGFVLSGLLLSAAPASEPVQTFVYEGISYDVYLSETTGGEFSVDVCARFTLTGSRLVRNTCSLSPSNMLTTVRFRKGAGTGGDIAGTIRERAMRMAKRANSLINTNTDVDEFWEELADVLRKS